MRKSEVERNILKWIKEVSKVREELGNFSICPFAEKARYLIVECSASAIVPVEGYQVIIYVIEDSFDLLEFRGGLKFIMKGMVNGNFLRIAHHMIPT